MGERVEPIKDMAKLDALKKRLLRLGLYKEFLIFTLGLNTGLRIGDILSLKWSDINGECIRIREQKTSKHKEIKINDLLRNAITLLERHRVKQGLPAPKPDDYVFESERRPGRPFTRQYIWALLNYHGEQLGLKNIGTHSMRKTFAWYAYKKGVDIALLCKVLNHASPAVTLRYIGIEQEQLNDVYSMIQL